MAGAEARVAPLPSRIGRHDVVGYIATGGMAELFLGKEPTGRPVGSLARNSSAMPPVAMYPTTWCRPIRDGSGATRASVPAMIGSIIR